MSISNSSHSLKTFNTSLLLSLTFTLKIVKSVSKVIGSISNEKALEKAMSEYRKYQNHTLSPVEEAYLKTLKETLNIIDNRK